jgi:hypothetical protein
MSFARLAARYALACDRTVRIPSAEQVLALRRCVARRHQKAGAERRWRISMEFAAAMRRRGWLHAEAYASGSWAAP